MATTEVRALIVVCDGPSCDVQVEQHHMKASSYPARLPDGWFELDGNMNYKSWFHSIACVRDFLAIKTVRWAQPSGNDQTIELREFWLSLRDKRSGCRLHGPGCEYDHGYQR